MRGLQLARGTQRMKRLLVLACSLMAWLALAQTGGGGGSTTIPTQVIYFSTANNPTVANGTYTFGPSECSSSLTVTWTNTVTTQTIFGNCSSNPFAVWVTQNSCGDLPAAGDYQLADIPGATLVGIRSGTFSVPLNKLPGFSQTAVTDGGTANPACGAPNLGLTHKVCGAIPYISGQLGYPCGSTTSYSRAAYLNIDYDTLPPDPPAFVADGGALVSQDQALRAFFLAPSDATVVKVQTRPFLDGGSTDPFEIKGESLSTSPFVTAEPLENYVDYEVQLIAIDAAGNVSAPSSSLIGQAVETCGFWCQYRKVGGTEPTQGCNAGLGVLPVLAGLWALRRAKKVRRSKS